MKVTGRVVDETGEGIPASIYLSDKNGNMSSPAVGVGANADGSYTLNSGTGAAYVTAQFVGTTKQTKPLNTQINFKLVSDNTLDEVVVTANKIKKPRIGVYIGVFALVVAISVGVYKYTHK